jgi:hypothetical protein
MIDEPPASSGNIPVTYQVYTPKDISSGRGPMRSMVAIEAAPKKMSFAARFGVAVVGVVVVVLTAAAVIAVSTEDPKESGAATSVRARPAPSALTSVVAEPSPTTIVIGDPPGDDPAALAPLVPTPASVPSPTTTTTAKPKPKSSAPSGAKAPAPPPNPYGK